MANETTLTIIGNLTADPELRHLESGATMTSFNVASTPRYYAREAGEWRDGEPLFIRCTVWRDMATHVTQSLRKGVRVLVHGRLKQRTFEVDGEHRTITELDVDEIGPSLRWATASVTKTRGRAGGQGFGNRPDTDPWQAPASAEPPF